MQPTKEQLAILDHTVHRAANGHYCGNSKDMKRLCQAGFMRRIGSKLFVPDVYFAITDAGRRALRDNSLEDISDA